MPSKGSLLTLPGFQLGAAGASLVFRRNSGGGLTPLRGKSPPISSSPTGLPTIPGSPTKTSHSTEACSVAVVSSVVVMSSHLITNRMRFYFFQSKCVVNVSSACHFPTRGGMQCKIVRLSLSFPRSKVENFMGYSCFMGLSLMPFGTLRIVERLIFLLRF